MVFHISENPDITEFIPRPSKYTESPVVWAVDSDKLRNYLVPRDCPRVTFYAGRHTTAADRQRLLGSSTAVVAFETKWWDRIRCATLYCYHLPSGTFECIDECAGYFVSRATVRPVRVETIADVITALLDRGVELRIVPALEPLRDAVIASSLQFSIIRMCKAVSA